MREILRREVPYLLDRSEAEKLKLHLRPVLPPDRSAAQQGYRVRSVYLESGYDCFPLPPQSKRVLRLRLYSPGASTVFLEMQQRQGPQLLKRALPLTRPEAQALFNGDYSVLLRKNSLFAQECFELMEPRAYRPKAMVEYRRQAFQAGSDALRITFDSDIRGYTEDFPLFGETRLSCPVFPKNAVMMEVKYTGFLITYFKELLRTAQKQPLTVSKYALALQFGGSALVPEAPLPEKQVLDWLENAGGIAI